MAAALLRRECPAWHVESAGVGPDLRGTTVPPSVVGTLAELGVELPPSPRQRPAASRCSA
jgi:protein-tyrosine-phosphatase